MKEANIGSLSWFAGVFWYLWSVFFMWLAWVAFGVHWNWAAWRLIRLVNKCNALAYRCAIEAGAEE